MLNAIEFKIKKDDLIKALNMLSPFILPQQINNNPPKREIASSKPYFYDKVTFLVYKTHVSISALTKEGVRIERSCNADSNVENETFCTSHNLLLKEIENDQICLSSYIFREERFFGFQIFDTTSNKHLFDIEAFSVSKQLSIHPKFYNTLYPTTLNLEFGLFSSSLKLFHKYTDKYLFRNINDPKSYIWFHIKEGKCTVIASSGYVLRQEEFPTEAKGSHVFSIYGEYGKRILDIISNWITYKTLLIGYNNSYLRLYYFNPTESYGETIETPLCDTDLPNTEGILERNNIIFRSIVSKKDLLYELNDIRNNEFLPSNIIMHFFHDHINFYCHDDFYQFNRFSFIYARNRFEGNSYLVNIDITNLECILNEIYTDNIVMTLVDDSFLYINNEDENFQDNLVRLMKTSRIEDEHIKVYKAGIKNLNSQEEYQDFYNKENCYKNDVDYIDKRYATIEEMKLEAIYRMREVIGCTDIIKAFENTGDPQIYEHPNGANFALDDKEKNLVRKVEMAHDVLVWGVIRHKVSFNSKQFTRYYMLHVSRNKEHWKHDRKNLRNGMPFVYYALKEDNFIDELFLKIFKTERGTIICNN